MKIICVQFVWQLQRLLHNFLLTPFYHLSFLLNEDLDGATFKQCVSDAYDEVVHWRSNLFLVPPDKVGKEFVQELAQLISAYGEGIALEFVAIKAAMIQCTFLLQWPFWTAVTSDFLSCFKRCLDLWKQGEINERLQESLLLNIEL